MWPAFLALLMKAFKSSPITSAMQVVDTAIMVGLYSAWRFPGRRTCSSGRRTRLRLSVIESDTQAIGSLK